MQLSNLYFSLCALLLSPVACGNGTDVAHANAVDLAPPLSMPGTLMRGRFAADTAGPRFAWPNSAVAAHFRGTQLTVNLAETAGSVDGATAHNLYDVVVDRKPAWVLAVSADKTVYPLASGLTMGEHTVWLVKRTESSVGTGQLLGFDVGDKGTLLSAPVVSSRRIEFIGDGEFTGAGAVSTVHDYNMCHFSAVTEDAQVSVPKVAADLLDADFVNVSATGKGVLQNSDPRDLDTLPEVYARSLAQDADSTWDFARWNADAVVISTGMADLSGDAGSRWIENWDAFVQGYANLVRQARKHYPNAAILCVIPAAAQGDDRQTLQDGIGEAVEAVQQEGDTRVWSFDYFADDPTYHSYTDLANAAGLGWGCDYHPSEGGARVLAQRLTTAIKTHVSW